MLETISGILEGSRGFLPALLPAFFTASFLLIIFSFVLDFPRIKKYFKIKKFTWIALALVFLLGILLRLLTPVYLTTYTDEFSHIDVGRNIISYGRAEMCGGYQDFEKRSCTLFNEPVGFPYVIGMFFLFLGVSEISAYAVNLIMGSLLSAVVFLFCFLLFRSEKTGLYGAFAVSILPLYMLLSRNIEPDTVSAFFILLTFTGFILFFKIRDFKIGVFAMSVLAFSISIKQENILLIPLVLLLSVLFVDTEYLKKSIKNHRFWLLALLFVILATPHILHLSLELYPALFYGESTATAVGGQLIKMENVGMNAQIFNKVIYGSFYPVLINLFLLAGLVYAFRKNRRCELFLVFFFSLYMFTYLAYSASIVEKYLITGLIPLVCFAGIGMYAIEKFVVSRLRVILKGKATNFVVPLALVLVLFLLSVPYFYELQESSKPLGVDHGYPRDDISYREREVISLMDEKIDDCYVVAEMPSFFSATDLKPVRTDYVLLSPEFLANIISSGGCVFYFEDLYCTDFYSLGNRCGIENETFESCEEVRQIIVSRCSQMQKKYKLDNYLNYEFGDFRFTVYNISAVP